jgi:hypothetical protein
MAKACFNGTYFLILILLVFFMLIYVFVGGNTQTSPLKEYFYVENKLITPEKLVVVQGNGIPDIPMESSTPDQSDPSAPSVDGTESGPKSKFLFAYNECKPECCDTSGGYSCNGGCPCITPEQKKFLFTPTCSK